MNSPTAEERAPAGRAEGTTRGPRVGVDLWPGLTHAPGMGRYVRELVRALAARGAGPRLALWDVGPGARALRDALGPVPGARWRRARLPHRVVDGLQAATRLGADDGLGVSLFHRVRYERPHVRRAAEVWPVAELPPAGSEADTRLGAELREAAAVVVFSAAYGRTVVERHGLDPARVHLTPVGSEHWVRGLAGPDGDGPRPPVVPRRRARILVLGSVRGERRPLCVLEGFERAVARGLDAVLVLAGHAGDAAHAFRAALDRSPVRERVCWEPKPREDALPALVASARVLLHLAHDEGSPVTPLEALALGTGVVAERLPAFEEALGPHATWVERDPTPEEVAEGLARGLDPQNHTDQVRAARRAQAAPFTWDACAAATLGVWDTVLAAR